MSSLPFALLQPRPFTQDERFIVGSAPREREPAAETAEQQPDPEEMAFERGFSEGARQAALEFENRAAEESRRLDSLESAIFRLREEEAANLREKLRQTVLALCEAAVLPLALDMEGLAVRIEKAAGMLVRAQDEKRIRINPGDFELVRPLVRADLVLEPDPSLEAGALRIDTEDGGVEDGPACWRAILEEALGEC